MPDDVTIFRGPEAYEVHAYKQHALDATKSHATGYRAPRLVYRGESTIVWRVIRTGLMMVGGKEVEVPPDVRKWLLSIEGNLV